MKLLFTRGLWHGHAIGSSRKPKQMEQDYLGNSVLHGMKQLFGPDAVDSPRIWSLYNTEFEKNHNYSECYGRGFSLCGTLDDKHESDQQDIERKIKSGFFDFVVLSCVDMSTPYMNLILEHTPKSKLISLDGHDITSVSNHLVDRSLYFKRELSSSDSRLYPISFAIPKEKLLLSKPSKTKKLATIIPGDKTTYIFTDETSYYTDYASSNFAITHKKAGWDCMRHYEILANRYIPIFTDIEECPSRTCMTLPKTLLTTALKLYNTNQLDWYDEVEEKLHSHFLTHCTTESLAKYILEVHKTRE